MPDEAIVRITQYAPDDGSGDLRDQELSTSSTVLMLDYIGVDGADTRVQHLHAIQNPTPYSGRESDYRTADADEWSDSPVKDPTRPDYLRYSYGRDPGRYRKLDDYAGVVIHDREFAQDGDYTVQEHVFNGNRLMLDVDHAEDGTLLMQDHARITGDATVSQYNFLISASPVPFSYKNAVDTDVSIRLSNYVFPLASGTVTLSLEGESRTPLEVIPFYVGLGGFDAKWYNDREFDYNQQVEVEWRFFDTDTPPNEIVVSYWFHTVPDYVGPRISDLSPADDETDVSIDSCVSFTLRDYERGININTLQVYVNNVYIDHSEMTITETSTSDGYDVLYCASQDFLYGDEIPVSVYVEDLADDSNYLFHVYSFTTEESLPPRVVDQDPKACREYMPVNKDVEVDVVDGSHGLDKESIRMDVDDISAQPRKRPIIYREE